MKSPGSESEEVAKAVAGDVVALEKLLVTYHDRLRTHINLLIPDDVRASVSADDVLQQTYLSAFRNIHRFEERGAGAFQGWLKVISERKLMDACRSRQRENLSNKAAHSPAGGNADDSYRRGLLSLVIDDEPLASQEAMVHELQAAFHLALARLPEDYKRVITLRYLEDRPLETVAQMLGISEGAVRGLCHRARQHLRQEVSRISLFV
jgi:RNA polymerase sigma-70 factor (ECF subfamily)